ncbi:MAG: hypothetical protein BRD46_02550 [Bacteroidetes bacterium QS_8_68_15]|nr:MAG: hypothetical protein BRD46_02550 [Bacteroidetes bacterium QS_8_68_15]
MEEKAFSMVQECTDSYDARKQPDGSRDIRIKVPPRFADLWLVKLGELRATMEEIREYEPEGAKKER